MTKLKNKINKYQIEFIDTCQTWLFDTKDFNSELSYFKNLLSLKEKETSLKMIKEDFRIKYIIRKGLLKFILGEQTRQSPEKIEFEYNKYKKPILKDHSENLFFNISHSDDKFLIGICRLSPIGVDIECCKRTKHDESLLEMISSQKELNIIKDCWNYNRGDAFLKTFVQKEAVSKALGMGMAFNFKNIPLYRNSTDIVNTSKTIEVNECILKLFSYWNDEYYLTIAV